MSDLSLKRRIEIQFEQSMESLKKTRIEDGTGTHQSFKSKTSDITIISSDNIRFELHKANLIGASYPFAVIVHSASQEPSCTKDSSLESPNPILKFSESSDVLCRVFEFIYPKSLSSFSSSYWDNTWLTEDGYGNNYKKVITAIEKYSIARAIELFTSKHMQLMQFLPDDSEIKVLARCFIFGDRFDQKLSHTVAAYVAQQEKFTTGDFIKAVTATGEYGDIRHIFQLSRGGLVALTIYFTKLEDIYKVLRGSTVSNFFSTQCGRSRCSGSSKAGAPVVHLMDTKSVNYLAVLRQYSNECECKECGNLWAEKVDFLRRRFCQIYTEVPF